MISSYTTEKITSSACRHCGKTGVDIRPQSLHIGAYCASCGTWLRWLSQGRELKVMPFGKHRGKTIADLPTDYLNWILENLELKGSLFRSLSDEFERRGRSAA